MNVVGCNACLSSPETSVQPSCSIVGSFRNIAPILICLTPRLAGGAVTFKLVVAIKSHHAQQPLRSKLLLGKSRSPVTTIQDLCRSIILHKVVVSISKCILSSGFVKEIYKG